VSSIYSLFATILFVIIIIQVERQIIMQTHKNNYLQVFRGLIAVMMALIGSIIIDQIIFKDDIDLEKEQFINDKIENIYPKRAAIRQRQIDELKAQFVNKDSQRTALNNNIQRNPLINITTVQSNPVPVTTSKADSLGRVQTQTSYVIKPTTLNTQTPNPNILLIAPLDSQIKSIQRMIIAQGDSLANLRNSIEVSLKSKTGFIDELNIMFGLLSKSVPALIVYCIWFLLLLGLELFVVMNKRHERPTDYDVMISHQMETHIKKLKILAGAG
jgi:hypothetical protein